MAADQVSFRKVVEGHRWARCRPGAQNQTPLGGNRAESAASHEQNDAAFSAVARNANARADE